MRSILDNKKGAIEELPAFFQIMLLVVVFAGLTFVVLDKFLDTSVTQSLETYSVANESGAWVNGTTYTIDNAGATEFTAFVVTSVVNTSNGVVIGTGNYTVGATGTIIGTVGRTANYSAVNVTYTYEAIRSGSASAYNVINDSTYDLYDYGIGFLGIIILVTMVYLIIRIVSGGKARK